MVRSSGFRILAALLLGAIVGAVAGYWVKGSAEPRPKRMVSEVGEPQLKTVPDVAPLVEQKPQTTAPVDFKSLLDNWYAEYEVNPPPAAGQIRGRVIDDGGSPLSGVRVNIFVYSMRSPDSAPNFKEQGSNRDRYIEAYVRYLLRGLKRDAATTFFETSAADGSFEFKALPSGNCYCWVEANEYTLVGARNGLVMAELGSDIELRLSKPQTLEVLLHPGNAPAGKKVSVYANGEGIPTMSASGEVGNRVSLNLPPGNYTLGVSSDDLRATCEPLEISLGREPKSVSLTIDLRVWLHGTVEFSGAKPVNCSVVAFRARPGLSDREIVEHRDGRQSHANVDKNGTFWFSDAIPGEYLIVVDAGGKSVAPQRATAAPDSPELRFYVEAPSAAECLTVSIYCPPEPKHGTPPRFRWANTARDRTCEYEIWYESPTRYRLLPRMYNGGDIKSGDAGTLSVSMPEFGTVRVPMKGVRGDVIVQFQKPVAQKIRIRNVPEELQRELSFELCPEGGDFEGRCYVRTPRYSGGVLSAATDLLQPGKYVLNIKPASDTAFFSMTQTFEVTPEGAPLELTLPALYEVRLDGSGVSSSGLTRMTRKGQTEGRSVTFAFGGVAVLTYVEPGEYTLSYVSNRESKTFEFTVIGDATFKIP